MADIRLTPDVYSQNATWSRKVLNKATSVVIQPIDATLSEPTDIHSEEFRVSDLTSTPRLARIYSSNTRHLNTLDRQLAKGTVALQTQSASKSITVAAASSGNISAYLTFTGKTYEVARGGSTYNNYPSLDVMKGTYTNLVTWIKNNATNTTSSISIMDISQNAFMVAPWVRNNVTDNNTTANDIFTNWWTEATFQNPPITSTWDNGYISNATYGNGYNVDITMFPPPGWTDLMSAIKTRGLRFIGNATASKTGDYTFNISWSGPTQILYMCASRSFGTFGGYADIDNYAFLIDIESIVFHVVAQTYGREYLSYTYGEGTDILKLDKTELLHNNTHKYTTYPYFSDWVPQLGAGLVRALKNGKITAQCSVPAPWAIRNNVHIGTTSTIVLQDGSTLSRGSDSIQFRVVRITKNFSATNFSYDLDLMEV